MHRVIGLALSLLLMGIGEVRADSIQVGDVLLVTTVDSATGQRQFQFIPVGGGTASSGGSAFNPFPFTGASAPLVGTNTSVLNAFPLTGAAAPLAASFTPAGVFNPF